MFVSGDRDSRVRSGGGVVPSRSDRSAEHAQVDRDGSARRHVGDRERPVRCSGGCDVVVRPERAEAGGDQRVCLVGDELVPGPLLEQRFHVLHLDRTWCVELVFPAADAVSDVVSLGADELPRVVVAVELPGRSAQERPVLLPPQLLRCAGGGVGVVLELVARLDHERGQEVAAVVVLEHLLVGRCVGVGGVESDQRRPGRVVQ